MSGDFTFLKGNIETIILCSLYNNDKYGYEIAKEIKERTDGRYEIKQPTLYSYLKRLEEDDLIVSYWGENSNGGRRRYYKLTKTGKTNCEQFISEWQYQRSVLSDLVDGTAEGEEITQEQATPLFGRRSARKDKKSNEFKSALDEQDEIARRLNELMGDNTSDTSNDSINEETPVYEQSAPSSNEEVIETETVSETLTPETYSQTVTTFEENVDKSRFDVNQDNAEEFLQSFEERAREVSEREPAESNTEGENYQHVIMGVLGNQLDEAQQLSADDDADRGNTYYEGHALALEDVADSLAKEGIRVRIYNHATAVYKSKMLIPLSRVLCQTAWITYAIAFLYFGILALTSITLKNWAPFLISLGVLLLVPIAFSINAIVDPTRKDKPTFNFRITIIVAAAVSVVIILSSVGFSALGNIEFSDFVAVSKQILIPTGIAILLPCSIVIFNLFYKRY